MRRGARPGLFRAGRRHGDGKAASSSAEGGVDALMTGSQGTGLAAPSGGAASLAAPGAASFDSDFNQDMEDARASAASARKAARERAARRRIRPPMARSLPRSGHSVCVTGAQASAGDGSGSGGDSSSGNGDGGARSGGGGGGSDSEGSVPGVAATSTALRGFRRAGRRPAGLTAQRATATKRTGGLSRSRLRATAGAPGAGLLRRQGSLPRSRTSWNTASPHSKAAQSASAPAEMVADSRAYGMPRSSPAAAFLEDAAFALEGLTSAASKTVHHASAVDLAKHFATPGHRRVLRSRGFVSRVVAWGGRLTAPEVAEADPVLCLALVTMLHFSSKGGQDVDDFTPELVRTLLHIIAHGLTDSAGGVATAPTSEDAGHPPSASGKVRLALRRVTTTGSTASTSGSSRRLGAQAKLRELLEDSEELGSLEASDIALHLLASATTIKDVKGVRAGSSAERAYLASVKAVKECVRVMGGVPTLAIVLSQCASDVVDALDDGAVDDIDPVGRRLLSVLQLLENMSFLNDATRAELVGNPVHGENSAGRGVETSNAEPKTGRVVTALLRLVRATAVYTGVDSCTKQSEQAWKLANTVHRSALHVLINLTNEYEAACNAVEAGGGMSVGLASLLAHRPSVWPSVDNGDVKMGEDDGGLVRWLIFNGSDAGDIQSRLFDSFLLTLAMLINCVETAPAARESMRALAVGDAMCGDVALQGPALLVLVRLFRNMWELLNIDTRHPSERKTPDPSADGSSGAQTDAEGEVDPDLLESDVGVEDLLCGAYLALLLGNLMRSSPASQAVILPALPDGSPWPLARTLAAFVALQSRAGVMTAEVLKSIRDMRAELKSLATGVSAKQFSDEEDDGDEEEHKEEAAAAPVDDVEVSAVPGRASRAALNWQSPLTSGMSIVEEADLSAAGAAALKRRRSAWGAASPTASESGGTPKPSAAAPAVQRSSSATRAATPNPSASGSPPRAKRARTTVATPPSPEAMLRAAAALQAARAYTSSAPADLPGDDADDGDDAVDEDGDGGSDGDDAGAPVASGPGGADASTGLPDAPPLRTVSAPPRTSGTSVARSARPSSTKPPRIPGRAMARSPQRLPGRRGPNGQRAMLRTSPGSASSRSPQSVGSRGSRRGARGRVLASAAAAGGEDDTHTPGTRSQQGGAGGGSPSQSQVSGIAAGHRVSAKPKRYVSKRVARLAAAAQLDIEADIGEL